MDTPRPSDRLVRATRDRQDKLAAYKAAVDEQTAAIIEDIRLGVPQRDVSELTGLSRQRLHQLVRDGK